MLVLKYTKILFKISGNRYNEDRVFKTFVKKKAHYLICNYYFDELTFLIKILKLVCMQSFYIFNVKRKATKILQTLLKNNIKLLETKILYRELCFQLPTSAYRRLFGDTPHQLRRFGPTDTGTTTSLKHTLLRFPATTNCR